MVLCQCDAIVLNLEENMKLLKQLKWNLITLAIAFVALGVILIIYPTEVMTTACYIIAALLIIVGVISLISYLRNDIRRIVYRYDLVVGLSTIIGGALVIVKIDELVTLIPVVLGFLVTISGILKMQNSIDMLRLGNGVWHVAFALAIINIIFGIILLINPFAGTILVTLMGVALIYSGITDLFVTIAISKKLAEMETELAAFADDEQ